MFLLRARSGTFVETANRGSSGTPAQTSLAAAEGDVETQLEVPTSNPIPSRKCGVSVSVPLPVFQLLFQRGINLVRNPNRFLS
jgi:hypothetical protein